MFRIGDFSRLSRVSVKALRHYDSLGLLVPVRVDAATGHHARLLLGNRTLLIFPWY
jgi:MerR family regulatory protein